MFEDIIVIIGSRNWGWSRVQTTGQVVDGLVVDCRLVIIVVGKVRLYGGRLNHLQIAQIQLLRKLVFLLFRQLKRVVLEILVFRHYDFLLLLLLIPLNNVEIRLLFLVLLPSLALLLLLFIVLREVVLLLLLLILAALFSTSKLGLFAASLLASASTTITITITRELADSGL